MIQIRGVYSRGNLAEQQKTPSQPPSAVPATLMQILSNQLAMPYLPPCSIGHGCKTGCVK